MHRFVAMLIILLIAMPALEIIKYEGKSGYDKYVLTLLRLLETILFKATTFSIFLWQ